MRHILRALTATAALLGTAAGVAVLAWSALDINGIQTRSTTIMLVLAILLLACSAALWIAIISIDVPDGIVAEADASGQQPTLEHADLSVLFCDVRGITSWSEDKGATEVIAELNVLLTELSASVTATGGTLDKLTGDGLMAFWGVPVPMEDHADCASRAALDMLRRLDSVNEDRQAKDQEPFRLGVAVHSGTVIGDTVSTTVRLEASTTELDAALLVSRDTVDLLSADLRSRALRIGDVAVQGSSRPVEAWALQPHRPEREDADDEYAA